jgi:Peptidase family M48
MRSQIDMQTATASARFPLPGLLPASPAPEGERDWIEPLIDRVTCAEQEFLAALRRYRPVVETYLQESYEGGAGSQPAGCDHYMIGRLSLEQGIKFESFLLSAGFRRGKGRGDSAVRQRSRLGFGRRRQVFLPHGFASMVAPDVHDFSRSAYRFTYVRSEFLGAVRCLVLDVAPRDAGSTGRFLGRIWVEDQHGCLVRFNGTFASRSTAAVFFHFDSWRFNVAARLWLPAVVYIEDRSHRRGEAVRFFGQTRVWGYHGPAGGAAGGTAEILVEPDGRVVDANGARDIGPLESARSWRRLAQSNLIDRLEKAGFLAAEGEVDETLNAVVHNLLAGNDISVDVGCRVLLTTPLESFSIGRAIIISRGLLDVLPDEASLAMVLSDELAHIVLGHPTDTMFAFADRTMFADCEIPKRLRFQRSETEMEAAHQKALEILSHSPYADKMATAGLFLKTLRRRAPQLPNLIRASLGNQLTTEEDLVRLGELAKKTPELKTARGEQVAALPLGSRLKIDPWTNQVRMLEGKPTAPRDAGDEAHFGVTPLMLHLTRAPENASEEPQPGPKARTAAESQ